MGNKYKKDDEYEQLTKKGYKRIFIVDTENIKSDSYKNLNNFNSNDEIFLMVTTNSNFINYQTALKLRNTKAKVRYIEFDNIEGIKNELDFKIVSLATKLLVTRKNIFVTIVSHDQGYTSAIEFIKSYLSIPFIKLSDNLTSVKQLTNEEIHKKLKER